MLHCPTATEIQAHLRTVNDNPDFDKELYPAIANLLADKTAQSHAIVNTLMRFNPANYGIWKNADLEKYFKDMPYYIKTLITDPQAQEQALRHFERAW